MGYVHGIKIRDMTALTAAEEELLRVYAEHRGKSFAQIAAIMGVSASAIACRGKIIREKLNVNSLAEAVEAAQRG